MAEYTPSTGEVRRRYAYARSSGHKNQSAVAEFDRWLAVHDAEVRAQAEAVVSMSAYDDGHTAGEIAGRASVATEEPDWEYRAVACELDSGDIYDSTRPAPSAGEAIDVAAAERLLESNPDMPALVISTQRRRKAGPWGPIEGAGS